MKNLKKKLNHFLLKSCSNLDKNNKNSFYLVSGHLNDFSTFSSGLNVKNLMLKNLKHLILLPFLSKENKHLKNPIFFKLINNILTLINILSLNKKLIVVLLIKNYLLFKKSMVNSFLNYFTNKIVFSGLKLTLLSKIILSLKLFLFKSSGHVGNIGFEPIALPLWAVCFTIKLNALL